METDVKQAILIDLRGANDLINQAQERLHPSIDLFKVLGKQYEEVESLIEGIEAGDFDKEGKTKTRVLIEYSKSEHLKFISDMEEAGLEIHFYRGRNFYQGPSVHVDNLQAALSNTKVECGWDSLGKGYVVHPKVSDSTLSDG